VFVVGYVEAVESSQTVVEKEAGPAAKKTKASKPTKDDAAQVPALECFITICPVWGRGNPFHPCPFTFSSFALLYLFLFSFALRIFFFCPSLPFLPE